MSLNKTSKKGTVLDILPLGIILFALMIVMLFLTLVWTNFNDDANLRGGVVTNSTMDNANTLMTVGFDNLFLLFFFGATLATVISAALVRTSALFFIVSLIAWIIVLIVGLFIKSAYENLTADALLNKLGRPNDLGISALGLLSLAEQAKQEKDKKEKSKTQTPTSVTTDVEESKKETPKVEKKSVPKKGQ